jgi:hypothetical protein
MTVAEATDCQLEPLATAIGNRTNATHARSDSSACWSKMFTHLQFPRTSISRSVSRLVLLSAKTLAHFRDNHTPRLTVRELFRSLLRKVRCILRLRHGASLLAKSHYTSPTNLLRTFRTSEAGSSRSGVRSDGEFRDLSCSCQANLSCARDFFPIFFAHFQRSHPLKL